MKDYSLYKAGALCILLTPLALFIALLIWWLAGVCVMQVKIQMATAVPCRCIRGVRDDKEGLSAPGVDG